MENADKAKEYVRQICSAYENKPDTLLEILHELQHEFGFLWGEVLIETADILNISRADIHGIVSFYDDFRREPEHGPYIKICRAEACQAVGGEALVAHAQGIGVKTHDVYCLGNCALGPAVMIDDKLYGRVNPERFDALVEEKP